MLDRHTEPPDRRRPKSSLESEATPLRLVRGDASASAAPSDASSETNESAGTPESGELSPALEDVVRRFGSYMRRTAHRHSIDAAELDDVVQEARIRLWKALGTPENIRQAPAGYIYRTAMSAALDFLRRRRARREESFDTTAGAAPPPFLARHGADSALIERETQEAVTKAVNLLVESRRGVVKMYLAGYDREEIADLLGWSEAKTRNLLYRGLADVRESMVALGYGPGAHS
jgi:RNA polymerase sigma factor (sigma-70 family)